MALVGPWAPLAQPLFRNLWIASLGANIGTWLQNVAAGWEMTNLSPSPLLVALVQVAVTAPGFALALVAGALADIVDRRAILIGTQIAGAIVAGLLALVTASGQLSAPVLLLLTFLLGVQGAMMIPAWTANIADIVPRGQLAPAVALGAVSFNLSRAIGPALGGAILTFADSSIAFALNGLAFVGMLAVLARWKRERPEPKLAPEGFVSAMKSGLRFTREEPAFRAVLIRCAAFSIPASAVFSLAPVIARGSTLPGPYGYALLLTAIGVGAVAGAFYLPRFRSRRSHDAVLAISGVLFAITLGVVALTRQFVWLELAMPLAGAGWLGTLSSLQIAAQAIAPGWVRARSLAIYFMTLNGAIAVGGTLWGTIATHSSVQTAVAVAAAAMLAGIPLLARYRLGFTDEPEAVATSEVPAPVDNVPHDAGPVLVQIEYVVLAHAREQFIAEMQELGRLRRRDGAYTWECCFDIRDRDCAVETFQIESWLEHLRTHERMGPPIHRVLERVRALCSAEPRARYFVSIHAGPLDLLPQPRGPEA
ncbi:MAG TPA: MFS transporter [Burkholderiaceae bacterium]|nr:MFS transporter [Burkholderiaceae bacterium]